VTLAAVVVGSVAGCSATESDTAGAPATGPPVAEGRSPASYFKAGDCIQGSPQGAKEATIVDCAKPHAAEVYAVFMVPDGPFPGEAAVQEIRNKCNRETFAEYAGAGADTPNVNPVVRFPDATSWKVGDRSVTCMVTSDPPRTGSVRERK
jgi:hypothetical protein